MLGVLVAAAGYFAFAALVTHQLRWRDGFILDQRRQPVLFWACIAWSVLVIATCSGSVLFWLAGHAIS